MMTGWFWLLISEVGSGLCGCIVWGLCWSRAPGRDYLLEESYWGHSSQEAQSERMVLDLRKPFKDTNQEPNLLQLTSALRVLSCPNSTIRPGHPLGECSRTYHSVLPLTKAHSISNAWVWWYMLVIPLPGRKKHTDHESHTFLAHTVNLYLRRQIKERKKKKLSTNPKGSLQFY